LQSSGSERGSVDKWILVALGYSGLPASIAVPRRHRRAKTDAIDGETLLAR